MGRADIISAHCVKTQGVASDEWSISSIDAAQIWNAIGPDSYELYYFWAKWRMDGVGLLCCGNLSPVFIFCTYKIRSWTCKAFVFVWKTLQAHETLTTEFYNNSTQNLEIYNASCMRVLFLPLITAVSCKNTAGLTTHCDLIMISYLTVPPGSSSP